MSPVTHFLVSWTLAGSVPLKPRERTLVTLAGVAPDLDGLGIVPELLTRNSSHPLNWFSDYHHVLGHNLLFAVLVTLAALLLATNRLRTGLLAFLSFHLHLLCDLVGARGPDGYQWPIPYLWPFSSRAQWTWSGQWALNAWPNIVLTIVLLALAFAWARSRGYSPLVIVSQRADAAFVAALRHRFPLSSSPVSGS